jgi:hypothetical protein
VPEDFFITGHGFGDVSKPCTPGVLQNSLYMDVHRTKIVSIGIDPYPLVDFNHQIESIGWGCETKKQNPLVIEHNNITIQHGP